MKQDINRLLEFTDLTHKIRSIKRAMLVKDEEEYENDSEHSFQLALIAMYVVQHLKLSLDINRVVNLALVHDVVEVYAGDTPIFAKQSEVSTQAEREKSAVIQLKKDWPDFALLHDLIAEYEAQKTAESKFVYAFDKLVPILNNYLDNGRSWKKINATLDQLQKVKAGKVSVDSTANEYYVQIIELLKSRPDLIKS